MVVRSLHSLFFFATNNRFTSDILGSRDHQEVGGLRVEQVCSTGEDRGDVASHRPTDCGEPEYTGVGRKPDEPHVGPDR